MMCMQATVFAALAYTVVAFECQTDTVFGNTIMPGKKGIAVDDYTLRWCSSRIPRTWPNSDSQMTSIRLFKVWDPEWEDSGRLPAWQNLQAFVKSANAKILLGTPVSCSEENDDKLWAWTKEFIQLVGPQHILGLAIGNEIELLQFKTAHVSAECVKHMWDGGYYWKRFVQTTSDLDAIGAEFKAIPVTSVFTGMALGGNPFYELPGKALVHSFLVNTTQQYGKRFVFTWNFYPYFDPNNRLDTFTTDQCSSALGHTSCWDASCIVPFQTRYAQQKIQKLIGETDYTLWIGETGWSWPMSGSLTTQMMACPAWSSKDTFARFYAGFLDWDLNLGHGSRQPDHVFWFTMRDSINFGTHEHFGLISSCEEPNCKLHSRDYVGTQYTRYWAGENSFCNDGLLTEGFISHGNPHKICENRCTFDERCNYYSLWNSGWCRLTARCSVIAVAADHNISIFAKHDASSDKSSTTNDTLAPTFVPVSTPLPSPRTAPTFTPTPSPTPAKFLARTPTPTPTRSPSFTASSVPTPAPTSPVTTLPTILPSPAPTLAVTAGDLVIYSSTAQPTSTQTSTTQTMTNKTTTHKPSALSSGSCNFSGDPNMSYFWDPACLEDETSLGCLADGKNIPCRFCGEGAYQKVFCPASWCEFDNPPHMPYYWDTTCSMGKVGCLADGKNLRCRFCGGYPYNGTVTCPWSSITPINSCTFEAEPEMAYFWDSSCEDGMLGCKADGRHMSCRFCGSGDYETVQCPEPVRPTPSGSVPNGRGLAAFGTGACRGFSSSHNPRHWFTTLSGFRGSLEDCTSLCQTNSSCVAVEFRVDASYHCELWHRQPQATSGNSTWTCLRKEFKSVGSGACRGLSPSHNPRDWYTTASGFTGQVEDCMQLCSVNAGCVAIEFEVAADHHCELWHRRPQHTSGNATWKCMTKN